MIIRYVEGVLVNFITEDRLVDIEGTIRPTNTTLDVLVVEVISHVGDYTTKEILSEIPKLLGINLEVGSYCLIHKDTGEVFLLKDLINIKLSSLWESCLCKVEEYYTDVEAPHPIASVGYTEAQHLQRHPNKAIHNG